MRDLPAMRSKLAMLRRESNAINNSITKLRKQIREEERENVQVGDCFVLRKDSDMDVYARCVQLDPEGCSVKLTMFFMTGTQDYNLMCDWRQGIDGFVKIPFAEWALAWEDFNTRMNALVSWEVKIVTS